MSTRTLVEFNHDFISAIRQDPYAFVHDLLTELNSGLEPNHAMWRGKWPAVRFLGVRHHSDAVEIQFGGYHHSEAKTPS